MAINDNFFADYNASDYTAQVIASKTYQDINNAVIHPETKDLLKASDLEAIKNSIKNIILTPVGTRPFYPEFGTNVNSLLFENFGWLTAKEIERQILSAIEKYESRLSRVTVTVIANPDANAYEISITFAPYYQSLVTIQFILNRIR